MEKKRILVIAPHPDDEILGCGGMMIKSIGLGHDVYVCVVTKGTPPLFMPEKTAQCREETLECHRFIGVRRAYFLDFPAVMVENIDRYKINESILGVIKDVMPDEVFIPHYGDMQKDHQVVAEASMVALRPKYNLPVKRIYGYETMSETGWNIPNVQNEFIPNVYFDVSDVFDKKIKALSFYKSELGSFPEARSLDAVESLARYRGATMHLRAAEAFMLIREIR